MESYIYLIKNKDLHIIGVANNIDKAQKLLKPGVLVAHVKTDNSGFICKQLYQRFSECRIPMSDYFRLNASQVEECKNTMRLNADKAYFEPIFKGLTLVFTFLISWIALFFLIIKLGINPIFERFF
ncbi:MULTISPECIES: GIY-YIG nuclease family protein [Prochlorococcus]|uniref:GIY-YIG nuclease family protein n=1 Tax=Prochlorococcus TaxID=1218 RepID=UPI000569D795|nr:MULTISPECIES: GIY-YIG nuclease family protein [Prochlorococcus]